MKLKKTVFVIAVPLKIEIMLNVVYSPAILLLQK